MMLLGDRQRLHQLPSEEIRTAEIAHLALMHEIVERGERLFERREEIEAMDDIEVDPVGTEPTQAVLAALDDVSAAQAHVVDLGAHASPHFGGKHHLVSFALERFPQDLLRLAIGIDVGGIEEIDPGIEGHVDQTLRSRLIEAADLFPIPLSAKAHRPQAQFRDEQTGFTQLTVFHCHDPSPVVRHTPPLRRGPFSSLDDPRTRNETKRFISQQVLIYTFR